MCLLTRLQQTWTLVLKLPMCTVRKSVLIWSLYFSSSSKDAKKKSDLVPSVVHTRMHPYCYKLVTGLSIGDTTTRAKVGAGNMGRLSSSASFPWYRASPGSEHGGLGMRHGLLHWLKNIYVTIIKKKKRYNTLGIWESSVDSCEKSTQHLCFHLSFLQERL